MQPRYDVLEVVVYKEIALLGARVRVKYFDRQNPSNKYNIIEVVISEQMSNVDYLGLMHVAAEVAAMKIGDPEFYDAMRDYFAKGYHEPYNGNAYQPYAYEPKKNNPFSMEEISKKVEKNFATGGIAKSAPPFPGKKATPLPGGTGLNMSDIDNLPGVIEVVKHPISKHLRPIKDIIINLNDEYRWTREQVADWLETLDVDLRFKSPDVKMREQKKDLLSKKIIALQKSIDQVNENLANLEKQFEEATLSMIELEATFNEQN